MANSKSSIVALQTNFHALRLLGSMGIGFNMSFSFNYNDSTLWVRTLRYFCDLLRKSQPTWSTTLFIQHVAKYIREIGKNIKNINSPRWASHPTLSVLHKEQLQHLVATFGTNLLQQKPHSLVTKVHSSLQTTLLSRNWNRWSCGHGRWATASPFRHFRQNNLAIRRWVISLFFGSDALSRLDSTTSIFILLWLWWWNAIALISFIL